MSLRDAAVLSAEALGLTAMGPVGEIAAGALIAEEAYRGGREIYGDLKQQYRKVKGKLRKDFGRVEGLRPGDAFVHTRSNDDVKPLVRPENLHSSVLLDTTTQLATNTGAISTLTSSMSSLTTAVGSNTSAITSINATNSSQTTSISTIDSYLNMGHALNLADLRSGAAYSVGDAYEAEVTGQKCGTANLDYLISVVKQHTTNLAALNESMAIASYEFTGTVPSWTSGTHYTGLTSDDTRTVTERTDTNTTASWNAGSGYLDLGSNFDPPGIIMWVENVKFHQPQAPHSCTVTLEYSTNASSWTTQHSSVVATGSAYMAANSLASGVPASNHTIYIDQYTPVVFLVVVGSARYWRMKYEVGSGTVYVRNDGHLVYFSTDNHDT